MKSFEIGPEGCWDGTRINGISGRIDARDSSGRWLGYYDKKLNETRDAAGRLLAKGNVLPSLIFRP